MDGKKEAYKYINEFLELSEINSNNPYVKLSSIRNHTFKIASIDLGEGLKDNALINQLFANNSMVTKDEFVLKILKKLSFSRLLNVIWF